MKSIKYILFTIVFLFINVFYVNASCTDEEINELKELAKDIKVTYKHKGKVVTEDGVYYNLFDVKVKNIDNDMYVSLINGSTILKPVDGEIVETFNNGTWYFDIYSNKCDDKIDTIKVFIPRFNRYSLDPLCEGIDGEDFALCGKYYEYDVDYDNFVARVKHYRATYKVDDNKNDVKEEKNDFEVIFNNILDFIIRYRLYIVIVLSILLAILFTIIIIKRRQKRGVLE